MLTVVLAGVVVVVIAAAWIAYCVIAVAKDADARARRVLRRRAR